MEKTKIISVLDQATDEIAEIIRSDRIPMEWKDKIEQPQQLLLGLLCKLQDSA